MRVSSAIISKIIICINLLSIIKFTFLSQLFIIFVENVYSVYSFFYIFKYKVSISGVFADITIVKSFSR